MVCAVLRVLRICVDTQHIVVWCYARIIVVIVMRYVTATQHYVSVMLCMKMHSIRFILVA